MITAVFIYSICKLLSGIGKDKFFKRFNPLPYLFLLLLFLFPYRNTLDYVSGMPAYCLPKSLRENEQMALLLKAVLHNEQRIGPCMVTWNDYEPNILWYIKTLNNKGHLFKFVPDNHFDATGNALVYKSGTKKYIEAHYYAQKL